MNKRASEASSLILALALFLLLPLLCSAEGFEYRIKAEYLERFTRFIEWPDDSPVSNPALPFTFCVAGQNPFGTYLEDLVAQSRIKDKKAKLVFLSDLSQIDACQLLFIANSEQQNLASILGMTRGKPILTIGDSPGFAAQGTLINLYREDAYIRFEVNIDAVRKSGLRFSSRLLKLARIVGAPTK